MWRSAQLNDEGFLFPKQIFNWEKFLLQSLIMSLKIFDPQRVLIVDLLTHPFLFLKFLLHLTHFLIFMQNLLVLFSDSLPQW